MTDYEFAKIVVKQLEDEDRIATVKRAAQKGFVVRGFSKWPHMAPKGAIIKSMGLKNKQKKQYDILIRAMGELSNDIPNHEFYHMARLWLDEEDSHEQIADRLSIMMKSNAPPGQDQICDIKEDSEVNDDSGDSRIDQLEQELAEAKERLKRQKRNLKENKISIGKLKEENERLANEIKKKQEQFESIIHEKQMALKERNALEEELNIVQKQLQELCKKNEELQVFREKAPKILCIIQKEIDIEIVGYNIATIHQWNQKVKEELKEKSFSQIWLVNRGFTYACINEIKNYFNYIEIKEYLNEKQFMDAIKMGGN